MSELKHIFGAELNKLIGLYPFKKPFVNITTKLTEKDFIKANFQLLWHRKGTKISLIIYGTVMVLLLVSSLFRSGVNITDVLFPLFFVSLMPVSIYFGAKKSYKSNKAINEKIEYGFGKDKLSITGESFNTEMSWNKIFKVTNSKNWLLIWQSNQVANIIPKRDVWEGDLQTLKEILSEHDVKNNL